MRVRRWSESEFGQTLLSGRSAAWSGVRQLVARVAPTAANVVILGEAGTGKKSIARAIHALSARQDAPFLTLRCEQMLSPEWERILSEARSGAIFLDDGGEVTFALRARLSQALDADIRLLTAADGHFSAILQDRRYGGPLISRLKLFPITVPPVRAYAADLPVIVRALVKIHAAKQKKRIEVIPPEQMKAIEQWKWPGNLVELESFVERAVQLSKGRILAAPVAELEPDSSAPPVPDTMQAIERAHILRTLRECRGVVTSAAARLGLPRTTLNARILKLRISRQEF
jgi:formate hydrogenlyase transcriptional activator